MIRKARIVTAKYFGQFGAGIIMWPMALSRNTSIEGGILLSLLTISFTIVPGGLCVLASELIKPKDMTESELIYFFGGEEGEQGSSQ